MLSLGLNFCPTFRVDTFELVKDIHLFVRRLAWKTVCSKPAEDLATRAAEYFSTKTVTKREFGAIRDLMDLLFESGDTHSNMEFDYDTGEYVEVIYSTLENKPLPLRKKSTKFPCYNNFPYASAFFKRITDELQTNLTHQVTATLIQNNLRL